MHLALARVGHSKVVPLGVPLGVDVWLQDQVVLIVVHLQARLAHDQTSRLIKPAACARPASIRGSSQPPAAEAMNTAANA
jgi:hypothetical protein